MIYVICDLVWQRFWTMLGKFINLQQCYWLKKGFFLEVSIDKWNCMRYLSTQCDVTRSRYLPCHLRLSKYSVVISLSPAVFSSTFMTLIKTNQLNCGASMNEWCYRIFVTLPGFSASHISRFNDGFCLFTWFSVVDTFSRTAE